MAPDEPEAAEPESPQASAAAPVVDAPNARASAASSGAAALLVAAGIFLSRIFGLVRNGTISHYLGTGDAADAYNVALRLPNFVQNLFGEGVLSASFIPAYASLVARGDEREAGRVAGAVFALLALAMALLVALGVVFAGPFVQLFAPGFDGAKLALTVRLVRIFFPGLGLLVLSAWCLGILNSHRRFLLSYSAPVVWNLAIIGALVLYGGRVDGPTLAVRAAWGSVVGALLMFGVQLPTVRRLTPQLRLSFGRRSAEVRGVIRNFGPALLGRGVVQISAWVDTVIVTLLGTGAASGLAYAQALSLLPVSLFGMAISAAELPAMSSETGGADEIAAALRRRLDASLRRVAFFIVPSAAAFLFLGDAVAAAVYQSGAFGRADSVYVWAILGGSAVGLLASTMGRLYSSALYAMRDARTPMRFAVVRIVLTIGLGYTAAVLVPPRLGLDLKWGAPGLTLSAGVAGWVEFALLRRAVNRRVGTTGVPLGHLGKLWAVALVAALASLGARYVVGPAPTRWTALVIVAVFGAAYLGLAEAIGVGDVRALLRRRGRRG